MTTSPYSPFKVAHHQDKLQQLRDGLQPVPLQVQVIISDLCNHNCSFCAYRRDGYTSNQLFGVKENGVVNNNPNRQIPFEKVVEILDDCKAMGVKAIQITGGGEPTVHPKHREIFQRVLDHGLDLAVVTNGTVMRDGTPEILARAKWVRVSVDAATPETYSKMREVPEGHYLKTLRNIERLVQAKRQVASDVILGIGFVVNQDNYKEIYEAVQTASMLGVDNIRVSAAFTEDNFNYHKDHYEEASEAAAAAKKEFERPDFQVFNLFGDRIQDLHDEQPEYDFCGYMHFNVYIGGDLNVYACCNQAYNLHGLMGSIKEQSFRTFWESDKKKHRYGTFKASTCARCMFNRQNRFVNYLIDPDPTHVNFI